MALDARASHLHPEHPHGAGLEEESPDRSHVEGAELLANQARGILSRFGFTSEQIDEWAETYIAENGSGDVGSFLSWVDEMQAGTRS